MPKPREGQANDRGKVIRCSGALSMQTKVGKRCRRIFRYGHQSSFLLVSAPLAVMWLVAANMLGPSIQPKLAAVALGGAAGAQQDETGMWQGTANYWGAKLRNLYAHWNLNETLEEAPVAKMIKSALLSEAEIRDLQHLRALYYYDDSARSVQVTLLACVPTLLGALCLFELLLRGEPGGLRRALCLPRLAAAARQSSRTTSGMQLADPPWSTKMATAPATIRIPHSMDVSSGVDGFRGASNGISSHQLNGCSSSDSLMTGHSARRRSYQDTGLTWAEWVLARQTRCRIAELARVLLLIDENQIMESCGMDALVILRFCALCGRFCALSAVWCGLLLPLWWASGASRFESADGSMKQCSLAALWTGSPALWTVVAAAYLCTMSLCGLLWKEYEHFVKLRSVYLGGGRALNRPDGSITIEDIASIGHEFPWRRGFTPPVLGKGVETDLLHGCGLPGSSSAPQPGIIAEQASRTVMIERIPPELREPAALRASFDDVLGAGSVHSVAFVPPDSRRLSDLLEERRQLVRSKGDLGKIQDLDRCLKQRRDEYKGRLTWSGPSSAAAATMGLGARSFAAASNMQPKPNTGTHTPLMISPLGTQVETVVYGTALEGSDNEKIVELRMHEVWRQESNNSPSPTLRPRDPPGGVTAGSGLLPIPPIPAPYLAPPPSRQISAATRSQSGAGHPMFGGRGHGHGHTPPLNPPHNGQSPRARSSWKLHTMQELSCAVSLGVQTAWKAVEGAASAVRSVAGEVAGTSFERFGQLVPASLMGTPPPSSLGTPFNGRCTPLGAVPGGEWSKPPSAASAAQCSSTAFVTMRTLHAACVARQVVLDEDALIGSELVAEAAPEPRDIIWQNAAKPKAQILIRYFFTEVAVWLGLVFWSVPVTCLQAWCSATRLHQLLPWLAMPLKQLPPSLQNVWILYVPVIALSLLMEVLPPTLHSIGRYYEGLKSKSVLHMLTMKRYWRFQLATLVVTTLSGGMWSALSPSVMGDSVLQVATYFFATVLFNGLVLGPLSLLRLPVIAQVLLGCVARACRCCCCCFCGGSSGGRRRNGDAMEQALRAHPPDLAADLSSLLLVLLVVVTYATIFPLIMLAGLLFFVLRWQVLAVRYLYVLVPRFDSGGEFFYLLWDQALYVLLFGDLVTLFVVGLKAGYAQLPFLLPLPLLTIAFRMRAEFRFAGPSHRLSLKVARSIDAKDPWLAEHFLPDAYWHPAFRASEFDSWIDRGKSHLDAVDEGQPYLL